MNADSGTGYLGFNNWRLPSLDVNGDGALVNCFGGGVAGCEDNEMGYLYWEEGITSSTPGPFSNIQLGYWYGTESASDHTDAWLIGSSGGQVTGDKHNDFFVWAVRSGDVSAVPILAAAWLFGSSLMGLVGIARKKTA